MEEEKNRRNKRNKKKKNRQSAKSTESATHDSRESASNSQSNVLERGEDDNNNNNNNQVLWATDELDGVGEHMDADKDGTIANCSEGKKLAEAKESLTLDRETSFLEKIKELQAEKDVYTKKEALLEEKIRQLLKEKNENDQKESSQKVEIQQLQDEKYASVMNETSLKNKLVQLEKEKNALIQKVDNLEQKNEHLLREMDAYLEKEAILQTKVQNLEAEKNLWIQKEAILQTNAQNLEAEKNLWIQKEAAFEEKIKNMEEEAAVLNLTEVNLQEKIKQMERERDSWILNESSAKESVANLTNDKAQLQAQVIELEQARGTLSEEKEELKEIISSLRLRITSLESSAGLLHSSKDNKVASEEVMNYKIDAAQELVERENSELVEKVNHLYAELDQRGFRKTEHFTPVSSVHGPLNAPPGDGSTFMPLSDIGADDRHGTTLATDSISEISSKMAPISGSNQSLEDVMVEEKRNGEHMKLNDENGIGITTSEMEADEIVQIPLVDENEVVKETSSELVAENNENAVDVPLTDAPLIGAPFRLISFVARYVSGADLVNKNAGR